MFTPQAYGSTKLKLGGVTFLNVGVKEPINKFDTACFTNHIKVAYFKEFGTNVTLAISI